MSILKINYSKKPLTFNGVHCYKIDTSIEFDPDKIQLPLSKASERYFFKAGAYVRKTAVNSIRIVSQKTKYERYNKGLNEKHSKPGEKPYDQMGGRGLRGSIRFSSDRYGAIIGSARDRATINGTTIARQTVASLHEHGGNKTIEAIPDFRLIKLVKKGSLSVVSSPTFLKTSSKTAYKTPSGANVFDPDNGRQVYMTKLTHNAMVYHSRRLKKRLFEKNNNRTIRANYPKRPFMYPAMIKSLPHLNKLWHNALNKLN